MARTLDIAPLTSPVSRIDIAAYRAQGRAGGKPWASIQVAQIVAIIVLIPFFLIVGLVLMSSVVAFTAGGSAGGQVTGIVVGIVLFAVIALIGVVVARATLGTTGRWTRWVRLDRFARANGLSFSPKDANPFYQGAIFQLGSARWVTEHLSASTGHYLDFGTYQYTTGSGRSQSTHFWGFLALHLERRLPQMMLDSKANNSIFGSDLPVSFDKNQVLHLEGDFDRYFTLYCPREYETDALYVFTPDLMALLIDNAAPFDVEIVDDWMFVYSRSRLNVMDPAVTQRMLNIVDTVGGKTLSQTDHYADARVGDPAVDFVAPQGARLKRRVSVGAVIAVALITAFWLWSIVAPAISSLSR